MCQHMCISVAHLATTKCCSPQWDAAQVHEKPTIKAQGTWAFHLVDGWYLFTSPDHYHGTHNCHIKHTKSKCLFNTEQFQHKRITNPSITHANKVMRALADCIKAIHGMTGKDRTSPATLDLQCIVDATQAHIKHIPNNSNMRQHAQTYLQQKVVRAA